MTATAFDVAAAFRDGITHCRKERWRKGYDLLTKVAQHTESRGNLPGVFYSYLGLAMAHCEGRRRDAMELCRYGLQLDPMQPESYLSIANVYLMLGRREPAFVAVKRGLEVRPGHRRLLELQRTIGQRRSLTFPFLPRAHPLNSLCGRLRAWVWRQREQARERRAEIALFGE
jgi:tetratricopeptide (TPR) repeat protein